MNKLKSSANAKIASQVIQERSFEEAEKVIAIAQEHEACETAQPRQLESGYTYASLAYFTRTLMQSPIAGICEPKESKLAECFAKRPSINGRFILSANQWTLTNGNLPLCQIRMVHIGGTKNSIINTWSFPFTPNQVPIFAAELIAVGGTPKLTFVDIQSPISDSPASGHAKTISRSVCSRFPELLDEELPPDWAIEASPGFYTFHRSRNAQDFPRIDQLYRELLMEYLQTVAIASSHGCNENENQSDLAVLQRYQQHHMAESPGGNFLGKVFGGVWTQKFFTEFLFSIPKA